MKRQKSSELTCILLVACMLSGCGIGEAMTDVCGAERKSYEMHSRLVSAMSRNGLDQSAPNYRASREQLANARADLTRCSGRSSGR